MSCEGPLKESLGESEVLNVRMCEGGVAEHALWNGDVVATEEGFVASSASLLGTDIKGACDGLASGGIEAVRADGTDGSGHICNRLELKERGERMWRINFFEK